MLSPPSRPKARSSRQPTTISWPPRSARAAAEAETVKGSRFSLGARSAESTGSPRYLVPTVIAAILILALASGIMLSQRIGHSPAGVAATAEQHAAISNAFTPAPPAPTPADNNSQALNTPPATAPRATAPARPTAARPAQPQAATPQGAAPQTAPATNTAKGPAPSLDRITQLANSGNPLAQTIIGLKELDGDGVPANPADADKWLERAAEQGQAVAQYRLGAAYERGQGVTANPATATHWYQLAANQGNRKAMHNLAVAYASGAAGKKDMAEAARWFAKAAALGLADSQFNLAVLYERGDGVPQSLLDAYKWYAIASAQGDTESKSRLTVLGSQLSDDDRNAAQKSAASFKAGALNQAANVPPEMADLAGN